jgi:hypothetical protein
MKTLIEERRTRTGILNGVFGRLVPQPQLSHLASHQVWLLTA